MCLAEAEGLEPPCAYQAQTVFKTFAPFCFCSFLGEVNGRCQTLKTRVVKPFSDIWRFEPLFLRFLPENPNSKGFSKKF